MDDNNPYATQAAVEVDAAAVDHVMLARQLKMPAVLLMIVAALGCALDIYLLVFLITGVIESPHRIQHPTVGFSVVWIQIGVAVVWLLLHVAAIHGARNMLRMRNYRSARSAAVIAAIPCVSPLVCFGIPIGIWCYVLLANRRSWEDFDQ
jgi:hypothetical protein